MRQTSPKATIVGIGTLPFTHLVIYVSLVMINFTSCFMIGKDHGWETFPKFGPGLDDYHLVLYLTLGLYPTYK
jgi:hypothetical protein